MIYYKLLVYGELLKDKVELCRTDINIEEQKTTDKDKNNYQKLETCPIFTQTLLATKTFNN